MRRAKAIGRSANRITLWRDADGDGVAERREVFVEGQNQPFGMALVGDTFYVGNTDGIVAFRYEDGATSLEGPGRRLVAFKPSGHWTRSLIVSPDGRTKIHAGVGSLTNIADKGMEVEEGRAAIWELDLATEAARPFATGLAQPGRHGLGAGGGGTGVLWTVVNERDGLGDETPPDYLTSVEDGGLLRLALRLLGPGWWTIACRRTRTSWPARSRRITRSAGTRRRWGSAGSPRARCRASARAWRSGSTAPGTARP